MYHTVYTIYIYYKDLTVKHPPFMIFKRDTNKSNMIRGRANCQNSGQRVHNARRSSDYI